MPNAETDGSVSNLDVPHRLTAKGAFQEQTSLGRDKEWVIRKHTEETEYASLDGGHTVVKETKVTVCSPCAPRSTNSSIPALCLTLTIVMATDKLTRRQAQVHILRKCRRRRRRG